MTSSSLNDDQAAVAEVIGNSNRLTGGGICDASETEHILTGINDVHDIIDEVNGDIEAGEDGAADDV